jgi:bacterioferritin-associated ferredoxin
MIICSCNVLSDREILGAVAVRGSACTVSQVYKALGRSAQCGKCAYTIKKLVQDAKQ